MVILVDIEGTTTSISFVKVTKTMAVRQNAPYGFSHFTGFPIVSLTVPDDSDFPPKNFVLEKFLIVIIGFLDEQKFVNNTFARIVCGSIPTVVCRLKSSFRFPVRETANFMEANRCCLIEYKYFSSVVSYFVFLNVKM